MRYNHNKIMRRKKEKKPKICKFDTLCKIPCDFLLYSNKDRKYYALYYKANKKLTQEMKNLIYSASSLGSLNLVLGKYKLKPYFLYDLKLEETISVYDIVSFGEYNRRMKNPPKTLDLSDLD